MKFAQELEKLINKHSLENGSNTPDFILARYLFDCLAAFDNDVFCRSNWYNSGATTPVGPASPEAITSGVKVLPEPSAASKDTHDCEAEDCFVTECLLCKVHHAPHCEATQMEASKSCPKCGHLWKAASNEPWHPCDDARHTQTDSILEQAIQFIAHRAMVLITKSADGTGAALSGNEAFREAIRELIAEVRLQAPTPSETVEYKQRRIEELRELYDAELDRNDKLETELVRYREALKFYAKGDHTYSHPENAVSDYRWDSGNRAREALKPKLRDET